MFCWCYTMSYPCSMQFACILPCPTHVLLMIYHAPPRCSTISYTRSTHVLPMFYSWYTMFYPCSTMSYTCSSPVLHMLYPCPDVHGHTQCGLRSGLATVIILYSIHDHPRVLVFIFVGKEWTDPHIFYTLSAVFEKRVLQSHLRRWSGSKIDINAAV